jgi:hypothetical protein
MGKRLEIGIDHLNSVLSFDDDLVKVTCNDISGYGVFMLDYYEDWEFPKISAARERRDSDFNKLEGLSKKYKFTIEKIEKGDSNNGCYRIRLESPSLARTKLFYD